jgi:sugar (pentulose or hexulose) kinase
MIFDFLGGRKKAVIAMAHIGATPGTPLYDADGGIHPGSCFGAAWTAAIGVGAMEDWAGVSGFVTRAAVIAPRAENGAPCRDGYRRFRKLYADNLMERRP